MKSERYLGYLWVLPAAVLVSVFCLYPPIYAIGLAFTDYGGVVTKFVGLENFTKILSDSIFWRGMKHITVLTLWGLITSCVSAILLAEMFFRLKYDKLSGVFRFLYIIPTLVPGIVHMLIWQRIIFTPEPSGLANSLLTLLGMENLGWYYDDLNSGVPFLSLILTGFPFIGGSTFLIYLAGLNNISEGVTEAAQLDGVTTWQSIWYIDIPFMMGQIKYTIITGIIGGLQGYSMQVMFTKGGPNHGTTVPGWYMYEYAFTYGKYGYASAVGVIMFLVILGLTIFNFKFINKKEESAI